MHCIKINSIIGSPRLSCYYRLPIHRIAENVGRRKLCGKFSYLDYLGEKTLANSLFQINTEIKASVKSREKTLAIGHQFAKFANVVSCQRFPLDSSKNECNKNECNNIGGQCISRSDYQYTSDFYVYVCMSTLAGITVLC